MIELPLIATGYILFVEELFYSEMKWRLTVRSSASINKQIDTISCSDKDLAQSLMLLLAEYGQG